MNDQIERLKENMLRISRMTQGDLLFLKSIPLDSIVFLGWSSGTWDGRLTSYDFVLEGIYRIHRDYNPEPEKPVFEGEVLCEVFKDKVGWLSFNRTATTTRQLLHTAASVGCCGYRYKENLDILFNSPMMYINKSGNFSTTCRSGFKPAALAFVCFKEEQE